MELKKIVVVGCGSDAVDAATYALFNMTGVVIVSNEEVTTSRNEAFERDPFIIKAPERMEDYTFYEKAPSKFMHKPKNNFKRR